MILKNRSGIITGSNRGIGLKILELLSKEGCDIFACVRVINDEFKKKKESLEKEYKNKIIPIKIDLSDKQSVLSATKEINSYKKNIDFLINNAATIHNKLFQLTKMEDIYQVFNINFFNQVLFTQGLLRSIIKNKKGSIIFLSSSAAKDGNIGRSAYASSKAALAAFAKVLSREVGNSNIRVNVVSPGLTNTEMMKNSTDKDFLQNVKNQIPLNRIGEPVDIAKLVLFLVSDLSEYVTGQDIRIDGGLL